VGLEEIIGRRMHGKSMGFTADIQSASKKNLGETLALVQPEDLLRFGLIPEFIGRLPVLATLHELDEPALIDILTRPKNALIKQYQRLFEFEKVKLKFTKGCMKAIAKEALKRKSGARGLRSILEHAMLDIMYEIPNHENIEECVISEDVILKNEKPILVYKKEAESA
jgi:ATP-dependent Clp protease ATP-binding subunit ClpX